MSVRFVHSALIAPLAAIGLCGPAHALEFSERCEDSITATERRILEAAFDFVAAKKSTPYSTRSHAIARGRTATSAAASPAPRLRTGATRSTGWLRGT